MKHYFTKILHITLTTIFLLSCNSVKRVSETDSLLKKNTVFIDSTAIKDVDVYNQLYQKPNSKLLGIPIRLHIHNLARSNQDSLYQEWLLKKPKRKKRFTKLLSKKQVDRLGVSLERINNWLKSTGEPPSLITETSARKSLKRLESYYWNRGWFNIESDFKIDSTAHKAATVSYYLKPKEPYVIDHIKTKIASKAVDSIYKIHLSKSALLPNKQYNTSDLERERSRLTTLFRNSGLYHFEKEYVKFDADTINTNNKVNLTLLIDDRKKAVNDTVIKTPFIAHKISKVNIYTDYAYKNKNKTPQDTAYYKGYTIFGYDKIKFTKRAVTNAVLIHPGEVYRDIDKNLTYKQLNNLRTFKYPNISYDKDPDDLSGKDLIANILLTPRKKYSTNLDFDVSTSNIQAFGIGFGTSLLIRNVFRGAEILEISGRGSVGSSSDAVDVSDRFFNISEIGADVKLSIPKIFFPLNTSRIVPKFMSPVTNFIFGINVQQNIGLDKQNATGILNYKWKPNKYLSSQFDLINIQYVRNLNTNNYFNIYSNSFERLNNIATEVLATNSSFLNSETGNLDIPTGANSFVFQSLGGVPNPDLNQEQIKEIRNINERKTRLTDDNLIFATNYTYIKNTKENLFDNSYSRFRIKTELAGNVLNLIANTAGLKENSNDRFDILGVEFSQYIKTELDYIKHIDLKNKNILSFRAFGGIAIPYGNANNIPFARSFFGGGPNDNRAWQVYDLGPGVTGGRDEFNEANMKIALNAEYRQHILGGLNGALFIDAGNIWNILDSEEDEDAVFSNLADIKELAVGSGFGLRYDFDFFVLRIDVGFKTFNPAINSDNRWFKGYNFSKAVYNFGINYPF